jgi:putative ATPase
VPSVILSGPPGCGKTTLAVIASKVMSQYRFVRLSAVSDGVADVRKALADKRPTLLFIDEIHRFTKNQQDALLHSVESGHVVLIGATSESPSTCINKALLSRCKVVSIPPMKPENIADVVSRALSGCVDPPESDVIAHIIQQSAGDARRALNMLEEVLEGESGAQTSEYAYDSHKRSEYISAFQKSIRGSDKDAAIFYMVAMLESGEDPMYIARRVVRIASEDVGMADPGAMNICVSAMLATQSTGMPECNTALGLAVAYLCDCPKSNAIELACLNAKRIFESHKQSFTVPSYIRPSAVGYIYTNQPEVVPPPAVKRQRYLPSGINEPIYPRIF